VLIIHSCVKYERMTEDEYQDSYRIGFQLLALLLQNFECLLPSEN
jgi:hypothetical protein